MIEARDTRLKALLTLHEGFKPKTYRCTAGKLTIGIGHNLDARPLPGIGPDSKISLQKALAILEQDLSETIGELAREIPAMGMLAEARQAVLVDMAFNMGVAGLLKFRRFLSAIWRGAWDEATIEMFNSRWAFQVGDGPGKREDRADRLSGMIRTGRWPEEIVEA